MSTMDPALLSRLADACKAADLETIRKIRALEAEERKVLFSLKGLLFSGVAKFGVNRRLRAQWITERVLANGRAIISCLTESNAHIDEELAKFVLEKLLIPTADPKAAFDLWHDDLKTIRHHEGERGVKEEWERLCTIGDQVMEEVVELMERETRKSQGKSKDESTVNNFYASGENSRINFHSTDNSTNTVVTDGAHAISDLVELSRKTGDVALVEAAQQVQRDWPQKESTLASLTKWTSLAGGMAKLMHEASPILHEIYKAISSFT